MAIQDEKLLAGVLHHMCTKMMYQIRNSGRVAVLILSRQSDGVTAYVREEHLEAASAVYELVGSSWMCTYERPDEELSR